MEDQEEEGKRVMGGGRGVSLFMEVLVVKK